MMCLPKWKRPAQVSWDTGRFPGLAIKASQVRTSRMQLAQKLEAAKARQDVEIGLGPCELRSGLPTKWLAPLVSFGTLSLFSTDVPGECLPGMCLALFSKLAPSNSSISNVLEATPHSLPGVRFWLASVATDSCKPACRIPEQMLSLSVLDAALAAVRCTTTLVVVDENIMSASRYSLHSIGSQEAAVARETNVILLYHVCSRHLNFLHFEPTASALTSGRPTTLLGLLGESYAPFSCEPSHLDANLQGLLAGGESDSKTQPHDGQSLPRSFEVTHGQSRDCKPLGPAVVTFSTPKKMIVASTWDDRGLPGGVTHLIYPNAHSNLALSLVADPPSAEDYGTHPGRLAPGYLWPRDPDNVVHLGTVSQDAVTSSLHILHQLDLEEGRSYRVVARSDGTVSFIAVDDNTGSLTSLLLPVSASGGNWSASGGYVATVGVMLLSHKPGLGLPGCDGAVWFEGKIVGLPERPFGPAGQCKLFVPASYHGGGEGSHGAYTAAVFVGIWLRGKLLKPADLYSQVCEPCALAFCCVFCCVF